MANYRPVNYCAEAVKQWMEQINPDSDTFWSFFNDCLLFHLSYFSSLSLYIYFFSSAVFSVWGENMWLPRLVLQRLTGCLGAVHEKQCWAVNRLISLSRATYTWQHRQRRQTSAALWTPFNGRSSRRKRHIISGPIVIWRRRSPSWLLPCHCHLSEGLRDVCVSPHTILLNWYKAALVRT